MRYTAKHRFADVGPRKLRLFADLIRGKNVDEALQLLRFYPNRGAKLVRAVVESAYGNADNQEHPDPDSLIVSECRVDGAPTFKRIQPRARGTAFGILRRMSHIIVSLSDPPEVADEAAADEVPAASGTPALPAPAETPATA
jgi:large subunit ribosomal protein L22